MALIKCFECGHQISDQAQSCPNCGAPRSSAPANTSPDVNDDVSNEAKHRRNVGPYLVFVALIAFAWFYFSGDSVPPEPAPIKAPFEASTSVSPPAEVIANVFEINTTVTGSILEVSLNTDLPDDTVVSVTVSRSYWEQGNDVEYARDYASETLTAGRLRNPQKLDISSSAWKANLENFRIEMAKATLGFEVARISDQIEVYMVVPVLGQTNPAFGDRNANLSGNAVTVESIGRLVSARKSIPFPLD